MALMDFLFGKEGQFKQAPSPYIPEQQQAFPNLLQMGLQGLGTGAIEEQARRGFRSETVPLLSERFANIGGSGLSGIGSSGYQNALQGAGTELETNLAALRQKNAMNLLGLGLTPFQGEHYFEPRQEGIIGDLINKAADAGFAALTGGLSSAPFGIIDLFKRILGGQSGGQTPSAFTGIQAERTAPLRQRLAAQSPLASLGQAAGVNQSLFSGGRFLGEQPRATTSFGAMDQFNRPGTMNAISLLNQAYQAGLPGAARGAFMERQPIGYLENLLGR